MAAGDGSGGIGGGGGGGVGEYVSSSERVGLVDRKDSGESIGAKCKDCLIGLIDCNCIPYAIKLDRSHQYWDVLSISTIFFLKKRSIKRKSLP